MHNNDFDQRLQIALQSGDNIGACIRVGWQNRFLLLRRSVSDQASGIYELPGGEVDPGEGVTQAAVRELFEESGIRVLPENLEPLGIFDFHNEETGKHKTKFAFSVTFNEKPEVRLSPDHDDFVFLTREEIEALPRQGKQEGYVLWEDHYRMLMS